MALLYRPLLLAVFSIFCISACETLDVENLNQPDRERIYKNPDYLMDSAGDVYRLVFNRLHSFTGMFFVTTTMADELSCSWGSSGSRDMSSEPRQGRIWNNTTIYNKAYVNRETWYTLYRSLSLVNEVLIEIEKSSALDNTTKEMLKAWGYFMQGVIHGYLGTLFDQGFIVDEATDFKTLALNPYSDLSMAAITYLDKAITACETNSFTLPDGWIRGSNLTNSEFAKLANFMAAKFLISTPRNATENEAVDWNKVKTYAQAGLTENFNIDIGDNWGHSLMGYSQENGWLRVDLRVLNMMDPHYPSRWNVNGAPPDPKIATSADARLLSDFNWYSTVPFRPERGYYHFSYYAYWRYPDFDSNWTGLIPVYPIAENNLMLAEAYVRTGNLSEAISIINSGTRVSRGMLSVIPDTATENEVLEVIYYERQIELLAHSLGTGFFDMRRRDYLQPGTLLHFPIPGKEIEILGLPYYSLGGGKGIEGIDYAASTSGWPGWNVLNPY